MRIIKQYTGCKRLMILVYYTKRHIMLAPPVIKPHFQSYTKCILLPAMHEHIAVHIREQSHIFIRVSPVLCNTILVSSCNEGEEQHHVVITVVAGEAS